jgi:transcriptional regulator with XRE-family HTH domain
MGRRERAEDHFRKRLKDERVRRKWSQSEVAKLLSDKGIHTYATTIAKIEAGDRAVRIDEAAGIADLFEVSLDSLLGRRAGLDNDLAYALRALREIAGKSVWDVNAITNAVRDRLVDVLEFEFEGSDSVAAEGRRALDALGEAMDALYKVAPEALLPGGARLRDDFLKGLSKGELADMLALKLLEEKVAGEEES